jgi:hypothetical protein
MRQRVKEGKKEGQVKVYIKQREEGEEEDPPSVSPLQVHVAAIRIAARLSHSREKEETDREIERRKNGRGNNK